MKTETKHKWVDGPDGSKYHCKRCGISKCDDHACYDTCESWEARKAARNGVKPLPPPVRVEVLRTAERYVSADRNATHGEPEDSFGMIAALWDTYLAQTGKLADGEKITRADVALLMVMQKTARAAVNPEHKDSWIDVAGYAACGYECALVDKVGANIVEVRDETGRKITVT